MDEFNIGDLVEVEGGAGHGALPEAVFRITKVYGMMCSIVSTFTSQPQEFGMFDKSKLRHIDNDDYCDEEATPAQFCWAGFGEGDALAEAEENYRLDGGLYY